MLMEKESEITLRHFYVLPYYFRKQKINFIFKPQI